MKRILLYGFFGIENAGNEAMLRAFCDGVREKSVDDVEFVVASRHPSGEYDSQYGVRTVRNFEYAQRALSEGRWLRGLNPDDSEEYLAFIREVAACDLVVLGPGQYLVETGVHGMLKGALGQTIAVTAAAELTGTPIFGLALASEDLTTEWGLLAIQRVLPSFDALTFRDPRSPENLIAAGIEVPEFSVLGDLALVAEAAGRCHAEAMLRSEGVPGPKGPRLAFAPRSLYWLGLDQAQHRQKIADVIGNWLSHRDRDVLVIPQNVYDVDGDRDDDRAEAEEILALLPGELRDRVHSIRGKYDPRALEAAYGGCDVTLSLRLHGAVFSCKQGTPPVMLGFMDKARGFFERLGEPACIMEVAADSDAISEQLESHLDHRDALSTRILASVSSIRSTASGYADIACGLLKRASSGRSAWAAGIVGKTATKR